MWAWPVVAGDCIRGRGHEHAGHDGDQPRGGSDQHGQPVAASALAVILSGIAFVLAVRQRRRIVLPGAALVCSFLLAVILISRSAPQVEAFADGALFELHTRNALHGQQVLGAYSQFGWNHPGPMAFYVFAPLYHLGGASPFALNAAAFTVNVLVLILTIAMAIRYGGGALPAMLAAWLLLYLVRVPELASSFWNPHFLILPLAALLVACAAVSAGHQRLAARGVPRLVGGASAYRTAARGDRLLRVVVRSLPPLDEAARLW